MTGSYFHRKIILLVALFAFCIGGFFPVERANAENTAPTTGQTTTQSGQSTMLDAAIRIGKTAAVASTIPFTGGVGAVAATVTAVSPSSTEKSSEISCGLGAVTGGGTFYGCVAQGAYLLLFVASWILWVAAILFNGVINYTLNMANVVNDIPIVALGWSTFRDIANICFIFIVLYIGISMIVGNGGFGSKQTLIKVIIGAMLINFSLFFTQVAIDASNIFALQFYHKIINTSQASGGKADSYDAGISAGFARALGLQSIMGIGIGADSTGGGNTGPTVVSISSKLGLNAKNLIIVGVGGTILTLITAFVFFAGAIMLLIRTVVLIFLMIFSPIGFLGSVLPELGKYTGDWKKKLTENLLFAPAYMAMLYLVMSMVGTGGTSKFSGVTGADGKKIQSTFVDMFAGEDRMIGSLMSFFILIALMVGCLIIAKNIGVKGSTWAEKRGRGFAKDWSMKLTGANAALSITRNTAGGLGTFLSENKALAGAAARLPFGGLGAAALMQRGKKLKDLKIGPDGNNKSFNDVVKDKTKMYSERGNLIEGALKGPAGKEAEERYLKGTTFSYASKTALSKAKKKSSAPKNKEALEALIKDADKDKGTAGGKFSKENYEKAQERISKIDEQIADTHKRMVGLDPKHQAAEMNALNSLESSLRGMKSDQQAIIKGYEDTVDKLDRIERSESKDK